MITMFITLNKVFKKIREWIWGTKTEEKEEPTVNQRLIMLNRSKRRYLASKIRKAKHNVRDYPNIKACLIPHSVSVGDLQSICKLAGVTPQELRDV